MNKWIAVGLKAYKDRKTCLRNEDKIEIIKRIVCDHFEVDFDLINTQTRKGIYVTPRHVIMWLILKVTDIPTTKVGLYFNQRFDHSSVIFARNKIDGFIGIGSDEGKAARALLQKYKDEVSFSFVDNFSH